MFLLHVDIIAGMKCENTGVRVEEDLIFKSVRAILLSMICEAFTEVQSSRHWQRVRLIIVLKETNITMTKLKCHE